MDIPGPHRSADRSARPRAHRTAKPGRRRPFARNRSAQRKRFVGRYRDAAQHDGTSVGRAQPAITDLDGCLVDLEVYMCRTLTTVAVASLLGLAGCASPAADTGKPQSSAAQQVTVGVIP